jgi:hypothetical protein
MSLRERIPLLPIDPGSSRPRAAEHLSSLVLYGSALASLAFAAQNLLVSGGSTPSWVPVDLGDRPWISGSSAVAFVIGVFSILAVRAQARLALRPVLTSSAMPGTVSEDLLAPSAGTYVLRLRNVGLGPATLVRVRYHLELRAPGEGSTAGRDGLSEAAKGRRPPRRALTHQQLLAELKTVKVENQQDVLLIGYSEGASIAAGADELLSAWPKDVWGKVRSVTVWITYRGVVGPNHRIGAAAYLRPAPDQVDAAAATAPLPGRGPEPEGATPGEVAGPVPEATG